MNLDWQTLDRWIMGEAWVGSRIEAHLRQLCQGIGPRWASSEAEGRAVDYIGDQMGADGLQDVALEAFELDTWAWTRAKARVMPGDRSVAILPFNRCPPISLSAPVVDAGYGTPREIELLRARLRGCVAVVSLAHEPFTTALHLAQRLRSLAEAGASVAVVVETKDGGRMEYHSATDWRDRTSLGRPLPTVVTTREDGALLRTLATEGIELEIEVASRFYRAPTANVAGQIIGSRWPDEHLVLGGHHDTVYGSPGGNDNASGTIAVLETGRVLAQLMAETGCAPGRSIRFVTYSAEEQGFAGASAYVARHYGPETPPRLAINLDELSTGDLKGVVLAFPHLRGLVQDQLDTMEDGLRCHVMSQLDASSDHFPFIQAGLDAAHLWRWRFRGRHSDAEFHHEPADTADKVNVRELKEYVGQLARLLLRLSRVPPQQWPENSITPEQVRERLDRERAEVVRVF